MPQSSTRRWLVEGLVILLSILLAFAIDAAWDARGERRTERVMREALIAEFEAVRASLPTHTEGHRRTVDAAWEIVGRVEAIEEGSWVAVPDSTVMRVLRNGSFDAPTGALDALIASGELRLIEDPELRRMLASWPARLSDATEDDRLLREFWGPELRRILSEDTNLLATVERLFGRGADTLEHETEIRVTNPMRAALVPIRGSSNLAAGEEADLLLFVDSILVRLRGEAPE